MLAENLVMSLLIITCVTLLITIIVLLRTIRNITTTLFQIQSEIRDINQIIEEYIAKQNQPCDVKEATPVTEANPFVLPNGLVSFKAPRQNLEEKYERPQSVSV